MISHVISKLYLPLFTTLGISKFKPQNDELGGPEPETQKIQIKASSVIFSCRGLLPNERNNKKIRDLFVTLYPHRQKKGNITVLALIMRLELSEVKGELSELKNVEVLCKLKITTQKQR